VISGSLSLWCFTRNSKLKGSTRVRGKNQNPSVVSCMKLLWTVRMPKISEDYAWLRKLVFAAQFPLASHKQLAHQFLAARARFLAHLH
jgi:hypothetical protein